MIGHCRCRLVLASRSNAETKIYICKKCGAIFTLSDNQIIRMDECMRLFPGTVKNILRMIEKRHVKKANKYITELLDSPY